jgi:glutamyl-tRNA synthetase
MSKRLGHLSLRSLRDEGQEPLAVAAAAVLVGSAEAIEPVESLAALAARIDFAKISHGSARFDPKDLSALTVRTLHAMPFADVKPRLAEFGIESEHFGLEDFWLAVRGNLARLSDAKSWWDVVHAPLAPSLPDAEREVAKAASDLLPPGPWSTASWDKPHWDAFIDKLKTATGKKGRALFHPLRLALTGREDGPELRALLPLIGFARAHKRLIGETA